MKNIYRTHFLGLTKSEPRRVVQVATTCFPLDQTNSKSDYAFKAVLNTDNLNSRMIMEPLLGGDELATLYRDGADKYELCRAANLIYGYADRLFFGQYNPAFLLQAVEKWMADHD